MKIIEKRLSPIDERLPYKEFIALSQQQAAAFPQEIVEDGVTYECFDARLEIHDMLSTPVILYRPVGAIEDPEDCSECA